MILAIQLVDRYRDSEDIFYLYEVENSKNLIKKIREINRKEQEENDEYTCETISERIEKETGAKEIDYAIERLTY